MVLPENEVILEASSRWVYCEFLEDAGPQLTIATAIVFCHRFYAWQPRSKTRLDIFSIATASLFLAGKVEETPKPLREVVRISYLVQFKNDHERAAKEIFQKDCYLERQDDILEAERIILHTLGFEFNVEHPYRHLLNAVKRVTRAQTVNESLSRGLAQVAWNFANDRSE
eukprot:31471-Pelagococcus_subviridis.AAC.4